MTCTIISAFCVQTAYATLKVWMCIWNLQKVPDIMLHQKKRTKDLILERKQSTQNQNATCCPKLAEKSWYLWVVFLGNKKRAVSLKMGVCNCTLVTPQGAWGKSGTALQHPVLLQTGWGPVL